MLQTRVSLWFGQGVGRRLSPLSPQHCPVWCEKHVWKDQRDHRGGGAEAAGKSRQQRLKILGKHYYKAEKKPLNCHLLPPPKLLVPAKSCCFKHIENRILLKKKLFYANIQNGHSVTPIVLLQQLERQFVPLTCLIIFYFRTLC